MKTKLNTKLFAFALSLCIPFPALANIWKGEVKTKSGEPVEFATVLVMKEGKSIAGTTTNERGEFNFNAPSGTYRLRITSVGYKDFEKSVTVRNSEQNLGLLTLEDMATELKGVEIKASFIKREADRFVVDVANAPGAIGKDGYELLKESPSVFVSNKELTVYGRKPTIYVNERLVNYTEAQLETYLRSLKAADIQKIEIIPQTGADYDANSAGGIIKITLKHRHLTGLDGETGIRLDGGKGNYLWNPYLKMNINKEKYSFYYNLYSTQNYFRGTIDEETNYANLPDRITASTKGYIFRRYSGGDVNFVYDFNKRRSIGATFEYAYRYSRIHNNSVTSLRTPSIDFTSKSWFRQPEYGNNISATVNYVDKLDSLGSTFKVYLDYNRNSCRNMNDDHTLNSRIDSLYKFRSITANTLASARADYEKVFGPTMRLKAGAKFTYSRMESDSYGDYESTTVGAPEQKRSGLLPEYIFDVNYTENVAALYATYTANLGRVNFVAGLRGEYTITDGKNIDRKYFDLFPNLSLMYQIDKRGVWCLNGQFSRTIDRPRFWMLDPSRTQISEFSYREGNPYIDPGYTNTYGLTLLFMQKYSLTAMYQNSDGEPAQMTFLDPENPHIGYLRPINAKRNRMYVLSLNAPVSIAKWWQLNVNLNALRYESQATADTRRTHSSIFQGNAQSIFNLPKKTFFEIDYNFCSHARLATLSVSPSYNVDLSLKHRMLDDKLTLSLAANNVLVKRQCVTFHSGNDSRVLNEVYDRNKFHMSLSVSYHFNSGKNTKHRHVESGASDDKSRMEKNK